ncbi:hypothetical protein [Scytonema sp. PCC 10023]|uniref:hypothetical protein n=1 Tax=Scytonema sp. PCC 10023 TaxID=1680591 RepID=UPI0039C75CB9
MQRNTALHLQLQQITHIGVRQMDIQVATKYYIANKPVQHKVLGLMLIVDLYPSRVGTVGVKLPNGVVMNCELKFLDEPDKTAKNL